MNKKEFIAKLRAALSGRLPAATVEETVRYYEDYINTEVRKGKREEDVLNMLGDPRLIARTILQTNGGAQSGQGMRYDYNSNQSADGSYEQYERNTRIYGMPRWLFFLIVGLLLIAVFSIVFSILSFLAPVIIVFAAVIFLVKLFRDWLD